MLSLLYVILAAWFGTELTRWFRFRLSRFETLFYGTVIGLVVGGYFGLGASYILAFNQTSQLIVAGLLGLIALCLRYRRPKSPYRAALPQPLWWFIAPLVLLLLWFGATTVFMWHGDVWINNGANYGDIRLHLAYIWNFLIGKNFPVQNPILSGTPPSYPFLVDFITSQLIVLGLPLYAALDIVTIAGYAFIGISLYILAWRITQNRAIATLGVLLLFLNGGIGFFTLFLPEWQHSGFSLRFLTHLPHDYSLYTDKGYYLSNFLIASFSTQRSLLFGFPLTLIILTELYSLTAASPRRHFLYLGIISTMLTIIHPSSLIIVGLYVLYTAGRTFISTTQHREWFWRWSLFLLPLATVGFFLIHTFLGQTGSIIQTLHITHGWLGNDQPVESSLMVWVKSGLILIPASFAGLYLLGRHHKPAAAFCGYAYLIFLITNIIVFHPSMWDNLKYLLYWYALLTIPLGYLLFELWTHRQRSASILVAIALMAAGLLDLYRHSIPALSDYVVATSAELKQVQAIRQIIPPKSNVLTYGYMLNPLVDYLGRRMVFGDPAWLWSHGVNYTPREKQMQAIYRGDADAADLLHTLKVGYVVVSNNERTRFPQLNEAYFVSHYPVAYHDATGTTIYKISSN